ncbi:ABC transporter substrate-binding protein [Microlunatus elymi]|uniref:ABC transporter substrate-binding protein n=1 Tax=Microlunatus elymi TaxID=2596828 RepID=A0A516PXS1_9ACTN|nr:ABC transporter substrate-binding protein [Microlunatus elymi]QDP95978.1 ABC transporter substrate-binding protein [Microlunatus elymi]
MDRLAVLVLGVLLLVAGCSSGAGSTPESAQPAAGSESGAGPNATSGSRAGSDPAAFPTTVDTINGAVTIPKQPQRVVLLTDQLVETAAAIGVTPVGAPTPTTPLGPWADGKINQKDSSVFSIPMADGVPAEKVAALTPDLIVGSDYLVDTATYAKLSKIAPTVVLAVNADPDSQTPAWESNARDLGRATGHAAQAEQVITSVNGKIEQVKKDNPQIAGKTFQLGNFLSASEFVCTNSDQTSSALFLRSLGLKLAKLPGAGSEPRVVLSKERFTDLNDVDLVIMGSSDKDLAGKLADDPIFRQLTPVKNKTADQVDLTWVTAYNIPTALSIGSLLDDLSPYLQRL